ncbi:Ribosomal-protein-S18p-alanine acetyltransferase [Thermodesulfovibrio sp. N1]|uniref:ribosomal protein S18-alanine N-acetyltransferase n=1 Tax=unclassified Thermodesulfovibrio TaxID=2645936 RepID=UPI00083B23ED|nr:MULTISPECIES: ribosomal protein S18-alanine N-acetyltransferase [unclassified Thermodesulfovibrio]MDI1471241.1 ribosomal protein S18-alanine N-acetyltransferase [Thermodesulfovibrio sp. 1176]ODA43965.1 Ribosomal-protein-S18p-alanine acetyltransferase [Thermodesulfovibrio sp. N1]
MNLKIREAQESDLFEIMSIAQDSFTIPWSLKSFLEELSNPQSILAVAEVNGEITGYIVARSILDEAEILSIAVKSSFRKQGIAANLVSYILEKLKNIVKTCYLEVRISNLPAINLYKKFGFKICSLRKNYYLLPQEDALIMKLEL